MQRPSQMSPGPRTLGLPDRSLLCERARTDLNTLLDRRCRRRIELVGSADIYICSYFCWRQIDPQPINVLAHISN